MFGMVPWRKEVENPLAVLPHDLGALYHRLFGSFPLLTEFETERLWNVEVAEGEKEVLVRMEVPGFELEDFTLEVLGDRLYLKAEHPAPKAEKEAKPGKAPKPMRTYERVLTLPEGLALDKIEARYHNGVLEIRLPRAEVAMPRRIPVAG
jgi:HSP20 family protein